MLVTAELPGLMGDLTTHGSWSAHSLFPFSVMLKGVLLTVAAPGLMDYPNAPNVSPQACSNVLEQLN